MTRRVVPGIVLTSAHADPVDVGAQSDLFGATAPAVASLPITQHNGGYRTSRGAQRKLQRVTEGQRLLVPDRRLCVARNRARSTARRAQGTQLWPCISGDRKAVPLQFSFGQETRSVSRS